VQSFHAVVKPLGETRPAWKVLRVLANLLNLPGFDFESSLDVLKQIPGIESMQVADGRLNNQTDAAMTVPSATESPQPVVASIYQLDSLVRRATSLQLTADARAAVAAEEVAA
jgi:NADH-quinone oxidoreductase subunit G